MNEAQEMLSNGKVIKPENKPIKVYIVLLSCVQVVSLFTRIKNIQPAAFYQQLLEETFPKSKL